MNAAEKSFIQILKEAVHNREYLDSSVEWLAVLEIAKKQRLTALVYHTSGKHFPQSIKDQVQPLFYSQLSIRAKQLHIQEELNSLFSNNCIKHFFLKGDFIARYYPHNYLRAMGDIDVVVGQKNYARDILISNGYTETYFAPDHEWSYTKDGISVELRDNLIYPQAINNEKQVAFFSEFWTYYSNDNLDVSFHFLFLILHLRKHMMNSGAGFQPFVDLAYIIESCEELNWTWIEKELKQIDLYDFTTICFGLLNYWFDVKVPFSVQLETDFLLGATKQCFDDGVFGQFNHSNKDNYAINAVKDAKRPFLAMTLSLIKTIFPGYGELSKRTNYSFLAEKPFLLPIA